MKFDLGNGFSMREMNGNFDSHEGSTRINLDIETANSKLNFRGLADRNIFDIIKDPAGIQKADLSVNNTDISLKDILYFKPDLQKIPGVNTLAALPVTIEAEIKLDGTEITMPVITISQVNSAGISLKGKIRNIFKQRNTTCELEFRLDEINRSWFSRLLKELKPDFQLPDYKTLSIDGTISDSLRSPRFTINLGSDLGKIVLAGSFDIDSDIFSFKSHMGNLMLGQILNNQTLGPFSGSAEIEGSGVIKKSLNADAHIRVDSFSVNGYVYQNSELECSSQTGEVRSDGLC